MVSQWSNEARCRARPQARCGSSADNGMELETL